jgi:NTP pyrophosphatase (non-canonical NTP hydrolase)
MKVSDFQKLIKEIYLHRDSKRGIAKTFVWLIEEIGELANLLKEKNIDIQKAELEIADVIAWTYSLANLLDIDIESALIKKYPNKCLKCSSNPCRCD